jgi:uncharacterized membrane protein YsdA (DUF1294 family)
LGSKVTKGIRVSVRRVGVLVSPQARLKTLGQCFGIHFVSALLRGACGGFDEGYSCVAMGRRPLLWTLLTSAVLCAGLCAALWLGCGWPVWVSWLAAINAVTLSLYAVDKLQAKRRGMRVPEVAFHGLALAGGVGGAWTGLLLFRHKTRHVAFWIVLVLASIGYVCLAITLTNG